MRLVLLIVDDLHPPLSELAQFKRLGECLLPPRWTFEVEPIEIGPPLFYESALGMSLAIPGIVHKLMSGDGIYDGAILGCFGDPGLAAAREVATFPVVGAGEACAHFACILGARFGVITILDSDIPVIETNLLTTGVASRCVGVRAIGIPVRRLRDDPELTVRRLLDEGKQAVEAGADVLILGCFGFSLLECAPRLAESLEVPVLDPLTVSLKTAEALVSGGYRVSRRAYPKLDLTPLAGFHWFRQARSDSKGGLEE
jgi:allantoin racemase